MFDFIHFLVIMDLFSLEEDECNRLFITQSSPEDKEVHDSVSEKLPNKGFIEAVSSYLRPAEV